MSNSKNRGPFDEDGYSGSIDYYNDDVSRKAVGKLFSGVKNTAGDGGQDEGFSQEHYNSFGETVPPKGRRGESNYQEEYSSPDDAYDVEDEDIVKGFEKAPAPPPPKKRPAPPGVRTKEDDDYDFSLYRKRKESGWGEYDELDNHIPPEAMRPKAPPKREAKKIESPIRNTPYPAPIKTVPPSRPKPAIQRKLPRHEAEDYDYEDGEGLPVKRIVLIVGSVVAIIIMVVLVFQVTSLGAKLKKAEKEIEDFAGIEQQNSTLVMEKEQLQSQLDELKLQLDSMQSTQAPAPGLEEEEGQTTDNESNQPNTSTVGTGTTHIVKSGDTLGKIAKQYYGNSSNDNIKKIQDANNLQSSSVIKLGQEIKIPE